MQKTNVEMLKGCRGQKSDSGYLVELPEVPSETRANAEGLDG